MLTRRPKQFTKLRHATARFDPPADPSTDFLAWIDRRIELAEKSGDRKLWHKLIDAKLRHGEET